MPFLSGRGQYQGPTVNVNQMEQMPGLMANPSAFQFLAAMMNQPGGFNAAQVPSYGTQHPFGVPMYLPEVISPRTYQPAPTATVSAPQQSYSYGGSGGRTYGGSER